MSRELTLLSLIAINLSLTAAPLNLNFFLGGGLALGFPHFSVDVHPGVIWDILHFGVDVLPGVTSFLRSAFIAPKAIVVLIDSRSIECMSNVLSDNKSTIVMSAHQQLFCTHHLALGFVKMTKNSQSLLSASCTKQSDFQLLVFPIV